MSVRRAARRLALGLVLIGEIDLLPKLFLHVAVPPAICAEVFERCLRPASRKSSRPWTNFQFNGDGPAVTVLIKRAAAGPSDMDRAAPEESRGGPITTQTRTGAIWFRPIDSCADQCSTRRVFVARVR